MSHHFDHAVSQNGKVMRFVSDGTHSALFEKDGTRIPVTILAEPERLGGMPQLANEAGVLLSLTQVARPCSCRGGVWKKGMSSLLAEIGGQS